MTAPYAIVFPKWVSHGKYPISCVTIHPSGKYFATGGCDNLVKIWNFHALIDEDCTEDKLIALLCDHGYSVNCVRYSPDGNFLASAGDSAQVFIWQRNRSFGKPNIFGIPPEELKPNNPVQRWTSRSLSGHSGENSDIHGISWSPDSSRLVSCSSNGELIVWDIKTSTQIWTTKASIGILSVTWDPLNRFIVAQLMDLKLEVFDVQGNSIKIIEDCFEGQNYGIHLRVCFSPDGSFVGASGGFRDSHFVAPFFQRGSFNFAFALEGHVSPISCVSCPPFLLKTEEQNYASVFACGDNSGVLSVWLIGVETKPLFIIDQLSNSACNDMAWSKDGDWLLIALDRNPITQIGSIICIHFVNGFDLPKADINEMEDIKARLLGETSFRLKSKHTQQVANILQSLEGKEKEIEMEVAQLTTEEVLEQQVETIENGVRTIQPVLLTAVEKQIIAFQSNVECNHSINIPYELNLPDLNWPKPSALPNKPSHVIVFTNNEVPVLQIQHTKNYCVIVASGVCVFKLSYLTGQRLALPFCIGSTCRHLSVAAGVVLAVGDKCYVLDLASMVCLFSCECPDEFVDFGIVTPTVIIGHSRGKMWVYDSSAESWVGGVLTNVFDNATLDEIEHFAKMSEHEIAASQWYDFGVSAIFSAYKGDQEATQSFLTTMRENLENMESGADDAHKQYAQKYIEKLEKTIEEKWSSKS